MLPAVRFYTYSKRFEEAYTAAMRPLTEELDMAQPPGTSVPTAI